MDVGTQGQGDGEKIRIAGGNSGSDEGGELRLSISDKHNSTYPFWRIDAVEDDLRFGPTGEIRVTFTDDGKVGIGTTDTTSPSNGRLFLGSGHVITDANYGFVARNPNGLNGFGAGMDPEPATDRLRWINNEGVEKLSLSDDAGDLYLGGLPDGPTTQRSKLFFGGANGGNSDITWMARSNTASDVTDLRVNIGDNGNNASAIDALVIGWTNNATASFVASHFLKTDGGFTSPSDARLKTNVQTITSPLDKVLALRGVTFNWKAGDSQKTYIGLIAQEVEQVLPELVAIESDGYKSVAYINIIPVLIGAIQELEARLAALEAAQ